MLTRYGLKRVLMGSAARWPACCLALAAGALAAGSAQAQQQASSASAAGGQAVDTVEEIVVTARRRDESLARLPASVTVASGETLRQVGVTRVSDLPLIAPGVTIQTGGTSSRSNAFLAIRGQGVGAGLASSGVVTYFSEVPELSTGFFDLQNVQVLKGPQGTLFGRVTTGGAVLFTPRAPGDELNGYIDVKMGEFQRQDVEFAVGGAVVDDLLAVRVSGQILRNQGFTRNLFNGQWLDGQDSQSYRAVVDFNPSPRISNRLVGVLEYSNEPPRATVISFVQPVGVTVPTPFGTLTTGNLQQMSPRVAAAAGVSCPAGACPTFLSFEQNALAAQLGRSIREVTEDAANYPRSDVRRYGFVNTTSFDINDALSLKNIVSYRASDNTGPTNENLDGTGLPLLERLSAEQQGFRGVTEELQLQAKLFDGRVELTTGGYYEKIWSPRFVANNIIQNAGYLGSCTTVAICAGSFSRAATGFTTSFETVGATTYAYAGSISSLTKSSANDRAIFGQADWHVTDKLNLTGGLRYTWSSREQETTGNFSSIDMSTGVVTVPHTTLYVGSLPFVVVKETDSLSGSFAGYQKLSADFEELTWTVAASYQLTDQLMGYATARRGYKAGGFNVRAPFAYDPETVTDYEIGAKYQGNLGPFQSLLTIDYFYDDYADIQRGSVIGGSPPYVAIANIAGARITGWDLSAQLQYEWFNLGFSYNMTDARYTNYPNTGQFASNGIPITADLTKIRLQYTAENQWTIRPSVDFGRLIKGAPSIVLSGNIYHTSSFASSEPNLPGTASAAAILPGYTRTDIRLEWRDIRSHLNIAVGVNNLGDYDGQTAGNALAASTGWSTKVFAEPRTWYTQLSYAF